MLLKKSQVSVWQSKSVIVLCTIWVDRLPTRCKCNQRWELAYLAFDAYHTISSPYQYQILNCPHCSKRAIQQSTDSSFYKPSQIAQRVSSQVGCFLQWLYGKYYQLGVSIRPFRYQICLHVKWNFIAVSCNSELCHHRHINVDSALWLGHWMLHSLVCCIASPLSIVWNHYEIENHYLGYFSYPFKIISRDTHLLKLTYSHSVLFG